jgi:hypothetical protein
MEDNGLNITHLLLVWLEQQCRFYAFQWTAAAVLFAASFGDMASAAV